jgi:hypothetical protein
MFSNSEFYKDKTLRLLQVIDRLEIGPVKLEPTRLICPYAVSKNQEEQKFDLIYKYQESVFEPEEADSQNLAGMIAAQIAINYGLFCKKIVFYGLYDKIDQAFIRKMTENTAREIFVKKFLEPNPFLIVEIRNLPPLKLDRYSQAEIEFESDINDDYQLSSTSWKSKDKSCAILSSGGKDSLLTYGIMNELGYEVHPIFGNESGRHWFTALNAYRYFTENISNTSRVWMNSDRLFTWMLRHFPFVRQDFSDVRSDEYPIRLWTVAVFLFGALPILRKRGIDQLLIGDEYDSTWPATYKGISHYNGLYDQSRYFDNALSYYYYRKRWGIVQFSILRQLSELLIEKVLVERYPELQVNQVSCHAGHENEGRIFPCGKCEKCRRIVSMLMAIGADPTRCGYSDKQIKNCLEALAKKGVHQESAGSQQLLWMLQEKGLIENKELSNIIKHHPEILCLRFHPDRSPLNTVPVQIREPLYKLLLEHVNGAVRNIERVLMPFNPLNEPDILKPNFLEAKITA